MKGLPEMIGERMVDDGEMQREWKEAGEADEEKRKLWENVVKPVVAQE